MRAARFLLTGFVFGASAVGTAVLVYIHMLERKAWR